MEADLEEVKRNDLVNELLLVNILPKHVAEHFIMQSPSKTVTAHTSFLYISFRQNTTFYLTLYLYSIITIFIYIQN